MQFFKELCGLKDNIIQWIRWLRHKSKDWSTSEIIFYAEHNIKHRYDTNIQAYAVLLDFITFSDLMCWNPRLWRKSRSVLCELTYMGLHLVLYNNNVGIRLLKIAFSHCWKSDDRMPRRAWNFRHSLIIPLQQLEYYGCICKQLIVHTLADICVYYCLEITYYSAQKLLCSPVSVSDYRHNWYVIQQRPEIPLSLFVSVTVTIFALLYAFCCCWEVFFVVVIVFLVYSNA